MGLYVTIVGHTHFSADSSPSLSPDNVGMVEFLEERDLPDGSGRHALTLTEIS